MADPHPDEFDDRSIIEHCLGGDRDAWRGFIDRYLPIVAAAVRRCCGNETSREEIEDRIQDVFVRLLDRDSRLLRTWDAEKSSLSTWLSLIARSVSIDAARRRRMRFEPLTEAVHLTGLDRKSVEVELNRMVESLAPRQRLVIELVVARGIDVTSVATLLDVEPQTVRSLKHKALTRLRDRAIDNATEGMIDAPPAYNPLGGAEP